MSLKLLLADDSAAIKKVVQLSLQDLGVEVKNVNSGDTAIEVAKQFKPDIAFVDVLLPQKSGYEVATEMKKDPVLKGIPVVLLWSAFMAFDESKFKACGASAHLEKPFEVETLRSLVAKLAPKAGKSSPKTAIDLPEIEFEQPIGSVPPTKKQSKSQVKEQTQKTTKDDWSMSAFEDIGAFSSKLGDSEMTSTQADTTQLPPIPGREVISQTTLLPKVTPEPSWSGGDSEWVRKDLGKFKVPIPEDKEETPAIFEMPDDEQVDTSFLFKPSTESKPASQPSSEPQEVNEPFLAPPDEPPPHINKNLPVDLSLEELSDIKFQTREIIEKVVWKLVPELASQLIKEELDRLLREEK